MFDQLTAVGVDLDEVFTHLEEDGVVKFVDAWNNLLENLAGALKSARSSAGR